MVDSQIGHSSLVTHLLQIVISPMLNQSIILEFYCYLFFHLSATHTWDREPWNFVLSLMQTPLLTVLQTQNAAGTSWAVSVS